MNMKKIARKSFSVLLAFALVVTSLVSANTKVTAASKYNCFLMYTDSTWKITNFYSNVANTSVANKKGKKSYTVSLKRSQCTQQVTAIGSKTLKSKSSDKIAEATVFCVDIQNMIKDYKIKAYEDDKSGKSNKHIKITNVVVKVDGKKVAIKSSKLIQGYVENNGSTNLINKNGKVAQVGKTESYKNYRLEIFNQYGDSVADPCAKAKAFAFKKSISVSFDITIK